MGIIFVCDNLGVISEVKAGSNSSAYVLVFQSRLRLSFLSTGNDAKDKWAVFHREIMMCYIFFQMIYCLLPKHNDVRIFCKRIVVHDGSELLLIFTKD